MAIDDNIKLQQKYLTAGALLGMLAVIFGAMGAHALRRSIGAEQLASFETAVRYQFFHALLFLILGSMKELMLMSKSKIIFYLLLSGVLLFSGSIYLLSTKTISGLNNLNFLGPVTPIGGLLMIAGWALLTITFYNLHSKK